MQLLELLEYIEILLNSNVKLPFLFIINDIAVIVNNKIK